jgi:hypothetical protein
MVSRPTKETYFEEDDCSDDEYYGPTNDDSSAEDGDSQALSVPTTVASVTDERAAALIAAQHKELQKIFYSKLLMIVVFLFIAICASLTISGLANLEEQEDFKQEVSEHATFFEEQWIVQCGDLQLNL